MKWSSEKYVRDQDSPSNLIFGGFFDNMQTCTKSGDPAPREVHAKPQNPQLSPYSCRGWS
jgi:hypothetical protein